mmetsp:Transcript_10623/g.35283  ORF Transcript_10623/g.35283 Transcript_10623/m.35283 type:complete len:259 (+) Transcript_10623:1608-2384(+)
MRIRGADDGPWWLVLLPVLLLHRADRRRVESIRLDALAGERLPHLQLELLLLLCGHRVRLGDDRHDVDPLVQPAHEGDIDVLEPVRRDEVEAAVDEGVLVAEPIVVARRGRGLGDQLSLEQPLDVRGDDFEGFDRVEVVSVARGVDQRHRELVLADGDAKRVKGRDAHRGGGEARLGRGGRLLLIVAARLARRRVAPHLAECGLQCLAFGLHGPSLDLLLRCKLEVKRVGRALHLHAERTSRLAQRVELDTAAFIRRT